MERSEREDEACRLKMGGKEFEEIARIMDVSAAEAERLAILGAEREYARRRIPRDFANAGVNWSGLRKQP